MNGYLITNAAGELWTGDEWVKPYDTTGAVDAATWDDEAKAKAEAAKVGGRVVRREAE